MSTDSDSITATELDPACWLEEYGDTLFRYALARLRNTTRADDMVQKTIWQRFARGDGTALRLPGDQAHALP